MSAPYYIEWCILLHHSNPAHLQMPTAGRRDVTRPENPFSAPNRLDLQARAIRVAVVTQPKARTKTLKTCGASVDEESHLRTVRPAAAAAFFSGPKPTSQQPTSEPKLSLPGPTLCTAAPCRRPPIQPFCMLCVLYTISRFRRRQSIGTGSGARKMLQQPNRA